MGGELRVAQCHEPIIYFHHPNPKGRLNITKEEEIRLNVYQRYPTNTSNYNKDALNIIEVDNIENCQKCTNTPSRSYPRLNLQQYQRPISPIGPPTRHDLQPLLVEWDDQKIGYPNSSKNMVSIQAWLICNNAVRELRIQPPAKQLPTFRKSWKFLN